MTVVETDRFLKDAGRLMPETERPKLIAFIGANPEAGDLMRETGRRISRSLGEEIMSIAKTIAGGKIGTAGTRPGRSKKPTAGERIIEGLEQAVAWSRGEDVPAQVTLVHVPEIDVREVRRRMGLSQTQFATKFGLPPATLRNWEQGRVRPDAPTRVLLAVIDKYPESVEDVLSGPR
jgi:putative transcriptional regulator